MRVHRALPFLILAFCVSAGQDIPTSSEVFKNDIPPNECTDIPDGGTADGIIQPEDGEPRDILVEIVRLKGAEVAAGSVVEAQVRLQNTSKHPIRIPWSTDPSIIQNPRDPEHLEWETATFQFSLSNEDDDEIALTSLTGWLYGSKQREGSELTLQPRDSITASVRVKLEDKAPIEPGPIKAGDWQLSADWLQMGKSWQVRECRAWNRSYLYQEFYRQKNPSVPIHILAAKPVTIDPAK